MLLRSLSTLLASLFAATLAAATPTYHADIQPLLQKHCVTCHRPGEVAPFALLSYEDAAKRADLLADVTGRRAMPPWKPVPTDVKLRDDRRLSDAELQVVQAWAKAGAPEGTPVAKPASAETQSDTTAESGTKTWQLGQPDLVLTVAEPIHVPADGRDPYVNVILPLNVPDGKYLKALEFKPGNTRVVHHAVFSIDPTGRAKELDAATPEQGFIAVTPPGRFLPGALGIWTPGRRPRPLGDGLSMPWPKDASLVLNLHLHPSGKPETEQSTIGAYFTDEPPRKSLLDLTLIDMKVDIAPGDKKFLTRDVATLPIDLEAQTIFPHMHMIGREIKITAQLPDGTTKTLFEIDDWDFNWQDIYEFAEPVLLPKGTELTMTARHDNSADNPQNPSNPPQRVRWGEQTKNEMSLAFLSLSPVNETDLGLASVGNRGKLKIGIRPPGAVVAKADSPAQGTSTGTAPNADAASRAAAFLKRADADHDGKLSAAEIRTGLGNKPTLEQVLAAMKKFDRDGDERLNVEEATAAVKSLR